MLEGFRGDSTPRTEGGEITIEPGGVSGLVAFAGPHLVDSTRQELAKAHERVGGQRGREGVTIGWRGQGGPLAEED